MKRYLLSLLLVCVGFISFCSSEVLSVDGAYGIFHLTSPGTYSTRYDIPSNYEVYFANYSCGSSNCVGGYCGYSTDNCSFSPTNIMNSFGSNNMGSLIGNKVKFSGNCMSNCRFTVYQNSTLDLVLFNPNGGGSCDPQYTSEECQSEYSLVPSSDLSSCQGDLSSCNSSLSSCNSNLSGCMTNLDNYLSSLNTCSSNLNNCNTSLSSCISSNCPVSSGNVSWSSLFINNIQHLGAPIIDITIPEEFDWDYVSTDEEFTLDIEGYNVDTEYMNGIINTQKTLPNDIDFNNIISSVVPLFVPGIVIIFFLYFIFKFIKKIF